MVVNVVAKRAGFHTVLLAVIPWAIFIAPVWGFVIVGQMIVDWGQCVTLYH
jgi:hypothetical protein